MKSMLDPHDVLGVSKSASSDVVQRAFKRAVRQNHPDLNPGDPKAADRLRNVVFAFQEIQRRATKGNARRASDQTKIYTVGCNLRGADLQGTLVVSIRDLPEDRWLLVELTALDACSSCGGAGWEQVAGSWGRTERWQCETCQGAGILRVERRVRVRIPARATDGSQIRLKGIGLARPGLPRGDAYVGVLLKP